MVTVEKGSRRFHADPVRQYLVEIGRYKRLTAEQEIEINRVIQENFILFQSRDRLEKELKRMPTLQEQADAVGLPLFKAQQVYHAREKMVNANLRLVVAVAKKYLDRGLPLLDLIQEGSQGLCRGVEKFQGSRGYRFSTYAYRWIMQAITRAIANQSSLIRRPVHLVEKINKMKKFRGQFRSESDRYPTNKEIAIRFGWTEECVLELIEASRNPLSLDFQIGDEDGDDLLSIIKTPDSTIEAAQLKIQEEKVRELLQECLDEKQRRVVSLRYGFDGKPQTLKQAGREIGYSHEMARQIQAKAMRRLREAARRKNMHAENTLHG